MPFKQWVSGELATAADMNSYLQQQVIAVFPDAAARDVGIPVPVDGQHAYLTGTDTLTVWTGSAWIPRRYAPLSVSGAFARRTDDATFGSGTMTSLGVQASVTGADPGRWQITWQALLLNTLANTMGNLRLVLNGSGINGDPRQDMGEANRTVTHAGVYQFTHTGGDLVASLSYQAAAGTTTVLKSTALALSWVGPQ